MKVEELNKVTYIGKRCYFTHKIVILGLSWHIITYAYSSISIFLLNDRAAFTILLIRVGVFYYSQQCLGASRAQYNGGRLRASRVSYMEGI